ncbi:signal recognition particle-docking protein FtsY [Novispirillum itersonii]|uniref:Signal recognition particle receptor FtsY n=1 Tax=Novispirillum itersonii TaxID=189 RepID=A0A7X0DLC7_NOVIT|nr:signal recognition particle-docking protein FtsY [Novispirillum itersonii]MBB6209851.1 fused signal recognition particle receptor [Novispirillum itersonii]
MSDPVSSRGAADGASAPEQKKGWLRRLFGGGSAPAEAAPQEAASAPEPTPDLAPEADAAPVEAVSGGPVPDVAVSEEPAAPERVPEGPSIGMEDQVPAAPVAVQEKKSWFQRLKDGLSRSSSRLSSGISDLFTKRKLDDEALEQLEELLITADLGVSTASKLTQALAKSRFGKDVTAEEVRLALAEEAARLLAPVAQPLILDKTRKPHVILVVGVNGAGKTTTIGKMARQFREQGLSVTLAAGDTFRAAAVEQLKVWGDRTGCPVIARETGADAAGLAYDALQESMARQDDVLMIDTAGRLHNKGALMEELRKIRRVIQKLDPTAPHTTLLVLDATVGQNAHQQVDVFKEMVDVTGLVMTKLDGTAKGGVVVALAERFALPVHFIGVGETAEDLQPFAAEDFARSLMGLS